MITALSCPFCGVLPMTGVCLPDGTPTERAYVRCKNKDCHVRPSVRSVMQLGMAEQSAIRRWNIRK